MGQMQVVAVALLGVWLGWTVFMWLAAMRTFRGWHRHHFLRRRPWQFALHPRLDSPTGRVHA